MLFSSKRITILVGITSIVSSFVFLNQKVIFAATIVPGRNTGFFTIQGLANYYNRRNADSTKDNTTTSQLNLDFNVKKDENGKNVLDTSQTNTLSWSQISTTATAIVGQPGDPSGYDGWSTKQVPIQSMEFDNGNITKIVFDVSEFELLSQYQEFFPPADSDPANKFSGAFLFVPGDTRFDGQFQQNNFAGTINIPVPTKKDVIKLNYKANKGKGSQSSANYTINNISAFNSGSTPGITPNPDSLIVGSPFLRSVPEPTTTFSFLAFGTLGIVTTFKRKQK